jgi:sugar lactone lactonase YvrE
MHRVQPHRTRPNHALQRTPSPSLSLWALAVGEGRSANRHREGHLRRFTAAAVAWLVFVVAGHGHPGGGIAVDAKGRVYFTDTYKGVQLIDERGRTSLLGGEAVHWMALDESGKWADAAPPEFGRASAKGAAPAALTNPNSPCAVDAQGTVYFLKDDALYRQPVGKKAAVLVGGAEGKKKLRLVTGLAVGPRGSVYALSVDSSDRTTGTDYHAIFKVDPSGEVAAVAENFVTGKGDPLDEVRWGYCRGLAVDESGTVYVAGTGSRAVYRIGPKGKSKVMLTADAPWSPTAVAVHNGEVYVLEYDHTPMKDREWEPRVRKIDKDGKVTLLAHIRRKKN